MRFSPSLSLPSLSRSPVSKLISQCLAGWDRRGGRCCRCCFCLVLIFIAWSLLSKVRSNLHEAQQHFESDWTMGMRSSAKLNFTLMGIEQWQWFRLLVWVEWCGCFGWWHEGFCGVVGWFMVRFGQEKQRGWRCCYGFWCYWQLVVDLISGWWFGRICLHKCERWNLKVHSGLNFLNCEIWSQMILAFYFIFIFCSTFLLLFSKVSR